MSELSSFQGAAARVPGTPSWTGQATTLLQRLVRIPSLSGDEGGAADLLVRWGRERGLQVEADELAVRFVLSASAAGPGLVLASHLDTVPPGEGWSVDPWGGALEDGKLYGRGAVDAKASVAAMAVALASVAAEGGPGRGNLELWATFSEETRDTTMPLLVERQGLPDLAVVGEPTGLCACVAQRGQLLLRLTWRGEQLHAGWAAAMEPAPANAIVSAGSDLVRLAALELAATHPRLGRVAVTPTLVEGGVARNVTPPSCSVVLDIRTTPASPHGAVVAAIREAVGAEIEVLSDRLVPAETPAGSALLSALRRAVPAIEEVVSPTCSDWVFLRAADAVKLGPGDSRRSHTADEWIEVDEVECAVGVYRALIRETLG